MHPFPARILLYRRCTGHRKPLRTVFKIFSLKANRMYESAICIDPEAEPITTAFHDASETAAVKSARGRVSSYLNHAGLPQCDADTAAFQIVESCCSTDGQPDDCDSITKRCLEVAIKSVAAGQYQREDCSHVAPRSQNRPMVASAAPRRIGVLRAAWWKSRVQSASTGTRTASVAR